MQTEESPRVSVIGLVLVAIFLAIALIVSSRGYFVSTAQDQPEELVLPVADYGAPERLNPEEKAKRLKRNERYDRQSGESIREVPYPVERIWSSHWARGISAIPVSQSDIILVGTVLNSQAYLSADKTGVYSEFEIRVDEILKGIGILSYPVVSVERLGGAVRFPSGVIQKYRTNGQGMPRQGRRYVLFLKQIDPDKDFSLVTGYELRGNHIVPLDGSSQQGNEPLIFDSYKGVDVTSFLKVVRDAIAETFRASSK